MEKENKPKKEKKGISPDIVPEGFTIPLCIVDLIPVISFLFNVTLLTQKTYFNYFYVFGGLICTISGLIKVLWKFIVVIKKKNVWWMFKQMRIIFPPAFLLYFIAFITILKNNSDLILNCSFYSKLFFTLWIIGMSLMVLLAIKLDSSDPKANWIEQITNSVSQIFLCLAIAFL